MRLGLDCGNSSIGQTGAGEALRRGHAFDRDQTTPSDVEALVQIEQRGLDRCLKVQRIVRGGLKHTMKGKAYELRLLVPNNTNNGRAVMLHAGVNSDVKTGRKRSDRQACPD